MRATAALGFVALALGLVACGDDPGDLVLEITLSSEVAGVRSVDVTLTPSGVSPETHAFELPAAGLPASLAATLPPELAGDVEVSVVGRDSLGEPVASGSRTVAVEAGRLNQAAIVLDALGANDGGPDLPSDLRPDPVPEDGSMDGGADLPLDVPFNLPTMATLTVEVGGSATGRVTSMPAGIDCPGTCSAVFMIGTPVELSATTTATFTGFFGGSCNGLPTCSFDVAADASVRARFFLPVNHVFVTSEAREPGRFDGARNADQFCDDLAAAGGMPPGSYRAWLSTSTEGAKTRILDGIAGVAPEGWFLPDGKPFTPTLDSLAAGVVFYPPRLDELGRDVGEDTRVVTETNADGTAASGSHCADYLSPTAPGVLQVGEPVGTTGRWTAVGPGTGCDVPARFYCFSVDHFAAIPVEVPAPSGYVFVSTGSIAPGPGGLTAADTLCNQEAAAANLPFPSTMALMTPGGMTVAARFEGLGLGASPVVRPDGFVVADSIGALLSDAPLKTALNVTADGMTYVDADAWVGASGFGAFGSDCTGWTDDRSSSFGVTRPVASTRGTTQVDSEGCNNSHRVLCLNFVYFLP